MNPKDFLQRIVEIYSPSGRENEVAQWIAETAKKLGYEKAKVDNFDNAILTPLDPPLSGGKKPKTVVLLGHIDTVRPFLPVKVEDNVLWGRGSVDAKGSFATFVFAALAAAPKLKNIKLVVAGASSEEKHGTGARVLAEKLDKPDAAIIGEPSSWEGITLGYKGVTILEFFKRKGTMHSANLAEQNVIEEAIAFTESTKAFAEKFNKDKTAWTGIQHRVEKFVFDEVNSIEQVKVRVKFRTPLGFDATELKKIAGEAAGEGEVSYLQSWGSEEACLASKNTPLVKAFLKSIRANKGKPVFKVKTGTADMNTFMKAFPGVPMVSYGPGDSNLDHTPEERLDLAELDKAVSVLTDVLISLDESL